MARRQVVKRMIIALSRTLLCDATAFQKKGFDGGPDKHPLGRAAGWLKEHFSKLGKTGRIVIEQRLGVTEGLQNRIGIEDLLSDGISTLYSNQASEEASEARRKNSATSKRACELAKLADDENAKKRMIILADSVLPAPDSPQTIHCTQST